MFKIRCSLYTCGQAFVLISCLGVSATVKKAHVEPQKLLLPQAVSSQLESFEPSGALHLRDLNEYLVVSDDTNKKDAALLFFVRADGKVENSISEISGLKKMTDMESIFEDAQGRIYIMSSQGLSKKGKDSKKRNLFVQVKRTGKKLSLLSEAELRPLLLEALNSSGDAKIKALAKNADQELDIESSYLKGSTLFVGFKGPQPTPGSAVVLKLGTIENIFSKAKPKLELALESTFDFKSQSKENDLLSDIFKDGENFWLSTTTEGGLNSRLWFFDSKAKKLQLKKTFQNARLEAIAASNTKNQLMLFFDQGSDGGLYLSYSK